MPARWDEATLLGNLAGAVIPTAALRPPPLASASSAVAAAASLPNAPPTSSSTDPYFQKTWPPALKKRSFPMMMPALKSRAAGDHVLLLLTSPLPDAAACQANAALQLALWLAEQMSNQRKKNAVSTSSLISSGSASDVPVIVAAALPASVSAVLINGAAADSSAVSVSAMGADEASGSGLFGFSLAGNPDATELLQELMRCREQGQEAISSTVHEMATRWKDTAALLRSRYGIQLLLIPAESPKQAAAILTDLSVGTDNYVMSSTSNSSVVTRAHAIVIAESACTFDCALADELVRLLTAQSIRCPIWSLNSFAAVPPRVLKAALQQQCKSSTSSAASDNTNDATDSLWRQMLADLPLDGSDERKGSDSSSSSNAHGSGSDITQNIQAVLGEYQPDVGTATAIDPSFVAFAKVIEQRRQEFIYSPPLSSNRSGSSAELTVTATATEVGLCFISSAGSSVSPVEAVVDIESSGSMCHLSSTSTALSASCAVALDYCRYRMMTTYWAARKVQTEKQKASGGASTSATTASSDADHVSISVNQSTADASSLVNMSDSAAEPDRDWLTVASLPLEDVQSAAAAVLRHERPASVLASASGGSAGAAPPSAAAAAGSADSSTSTLPKVEGERLIPTILDMLRGTTGDRAWDGLAAALQQPAPTAAAGVTTLSSVAVAALAAFAARLLDWTAGLPSSTVLRLLSDMLLSCVHPSWAPAAGCETQQEALWLAVTCAGSALHAPPRSASHG